MKVAVVTDSGSNYREENYDVEGIYCVPLTLLDDKRTYQIGEDITVSEVYDRIDKGEMFKTSQPSFGRIVELFEEIKKSYDMIFAVPINPGLSGCLSSMVMAAEQVGIPIETVDVYSPASNQLYTTLTARKMLDAGKDPKEVKDILQKAVEDSVTFVMPTNLNHLVRGGRITKRTAVVAGLLKISPITIVNKESGGTNDSFANPRTLKKAEEMVIDYFREHGVGKGYRICVAHVKNIEEGTKFYNMMKEAFPEADIYITDLVTAVGCHTGVGCVACQYIKELDI